MRPIDFENAQEEAERYIKSSLRNYGDSPLGTPNYEPFTGDFVLWFIPGEGSLLRPMKFTGGQYEKSFGIQDVTMAMGVAYIQNLIAETQNVNARCRRVTNHLNDKNGVLLVHYQLTNIGDIIIAFPNHDYLVGIGLRS